MQGMGENPRDGLLKALASADDRIRITTAALMVQVGFEQNTAAPVLVDALKHDDGELRMRAARNACTRQLETGKLMPFFTEGSRTRRRASAFRRYPRAANARLRTPIMPPT